ncbi:hypothetical protein AZ78_3137 [Lysobacter capsici AZ78]|uniref:Secreted protein n=1 Tax=Lysobacter capsici AZ78 TaxID=1444315 RepID=A0A120AH43_9GAMM|nr:hypothetical protein [Lysobacter capsici]KWS05585.1 hypothetical protein AZ78_3137 [Lysobacter capsici AZ78]
MKHIRLLHAPIRAVAIAALAMSFAGSVAAAAGTQACKQRLLREFGWRFVSSESNAVEIHPGHPCDRRDLAEAKAAGDLTVAMPAGLAASERERVFDGLLRHPATHCAYGFALGAATRRAVDRLVDNRGFAFTAVQIGWIGFGASGSAHDGWTPVALFGRGYKPRGGNSRAIDAFYDGRVRAECGVGRQVAQYATQAELYGRDGFDSQFDADEIVIGTFNRLHRTRSILLGTSAGDFTHDGRASAAAASGRQAFMGLPGFVFHVFDRASLDDLNNQAENFVVYDVSSKAATALRRHGGFEYYNDRNREIWSLARSLKLDKSKRLFERLLYERDPALRAALSDDARVTVAKIDRLLADPFYRGFSIYVHKLGIKPVGFHIARLLDRNPRTPFRIELALHNLHTTLYDRYVGYRLARCAGTVTDVSRGS